MGALQTDEYRLVIRAAGIDDLGAELAKARVVEDVIELEAKHEVADRPLPRRLASELRRRQGSMNEGIVVGSDGNSYLLSWNNGFSYYAPGGTKVAMAQSALGSDGTWWGVKADGSIWRFTPSPPR